MHCNSQWSCRAAFVADEISGACSDDCCIKRCIIDRQPNKPSSEANFSSLKTFPRINLKIKINTIHNDPGVV